MLRASYFFHVEPVERVSLEKILVPEDACPQEVDLLARVLVSSGFDVRGRAL